MVQSCGPVAWSIDKCKWRELEHHNAKARAKAHCCGSYNLLSRELSIQEEGVGVGLVCGAVGVAGAIREGAGDALKCLDKKTKVGGHLLRCGAVGGEKWGAVESAIKAHSAQQRMRGVGVQASRGEASLVIGFAAGSRGVDQILPARKCPGRSAEQEATGKAGREVVEGWEL